MGDLVSGRRPATLKDVQSGSDLLFASQRCDNLVLNKLNISHSTFINISFLRTKITGSEFQNCVFEECYFRRADIKRSQFVGCRFINCTFDYIGITDVDFRFADFRNTALPFKEARRNAPPEHNLRQDLFSNLSRAATLSGDEVEARKYRLAAIEAENENLKAAILGESAWHKEHYDLVRRAESVIRLGWHYLNKYLWRHGESAAVLFASAIVVTLLVFPVLLYFDRDSFNLRPLPSYGQLIWMSMSNFISLDRLSQLNPESTYMRFVSTLEGLAGIIFTGMFVTVLVKALLRR
ncbi:pentapeptide repeat-containing protein [Kribbella soli]|uniref:pentapeptide repeat-containing protein n=1 Tax=Kribbella soli TaxID=1124743 RepID=UPI0013F44E91|nr:pentapeptide repeat-containing protein [Kribbella soli]